LLSDVLKNFKGKIGFYFSYPRVKIVLTGELQEISETFEKIQSALKSNQVKYVTCNSVEQEVHNCLKKLRLSISTCESFTGGLLANSLMQYPSSSSYFRGGLILYSVKEKAKFLEKDITNPVTEEIALKLAIKTRERFETDLAVSTTGVAGPGEDEFGNEEGLMYIATATAEGARAKKFQLKKDRSKIIVAGVALALFEILDLLKESKEP
jgi:nicotinamide-nucleotide amidase